MKMSEDPNHYQQADRMAILKSVVDCHWTTKAITVMEARDKNYVPRNETCKACLACQEVKI